MVLLPTAVALLVAGGLVLAGAPVVAALQLPPPARLTVENLLQPPPTAAGEALVVSTARPRFGFVPHALHEHPGAGVRMTAYRIVVKAVAAADADPVWDSGVVNASAAIGVRCGADLAPRMSYTYTAQWWGTGSKAPSKVTGSKVTTASFDVGPGYM